MAGIVDPRRINKSGENFVCEVARTSFYVTTFNEHAIVSINDVPVVEQQVASS